MAVDTAPVRQRRTANLCMALEAPDPGMTALEREMALRYPPEQRPCDRRVAHGAFERTDLVRGLLRVAALASGRWEGFTLGMALQAPDNRVQADVEVVVDVVEAHVAPRRRRVARLALTSIRLEVLVVV